MYLYLEQLRWIAAGGSLTESNWLGDTEYSCRPSSSVTGWLLWLKRGRGILVQQPIH